MEDEMDIDIEGGDFEVNIRQTDAGGLAEEQLLQPAGTDGSWNVPWQVDTSISPENRDLIQKMLLEEQYYLTGRGTPNDDLYSNANKKAKVKKSPSKSSASTLSSCWSKEEKQLFEEGLTQFGQKWTRIAKQVGTRTVIQVKSYAKHYFKQKRKSEPGAAAPSTGPVLHPQSIPSEASTLANAVRIEKLSDDEDVDITDDLSEDEATDVKTQAEPKTELLGSEEQVKGEIQTEKSSQEPEKTAQNETESIWNAVQSHRKSFCPQSRDASSSGVCAEENRETRLHHNISKTGQIFPGSFQTQTGFKQVTGDLQDQSCQCDLIAQTGDVENHSFERMDSAEKVHKNEEEQQNGDEAEEELKAPEQEAELDTGTITEDEKQAIPEFFEGRPSKTPERYLKIRNYILDQWMKSKPKYLNKTSVRPGLKNCGDVNCIGRIHTYLELIGAINFNCEQAVYNRPKLVDRSRVKASRDVLEAYQLAQRLQSMRTRKRRVRDVWGNWCDAKDSEGQTYEHLSAEELVLQREGRKKHPKPSKMARYPERSSDPFRLIPCRSFDEDIPEPFQVEVCAETLLIMDMHAHVSRGEVIGLLGGHFNGDAKILKVCAAEPCNSMSTGMQCEMDPVSQTQACDVLLSLGLSVVGWYHSHPSFHPNPSVRDISTQDQFQSYFSRGGAPFIGMIVSPYDPANRSPHSQITCLLVKENPNSSSPQKLPYRFNFLSSNHIPDWEQTTRRAEWIIQKYDQPPGSAQMDRLFRRESQLSCLEKMLASLAKHLEPLPDSEGDHFLKHIQTLFQSGFISKQLSSNQEEEGPLRISKPPDSAEIYYGQLTSKEKLVGSEGVPEETTLLNLGSVLTTEHDYLL
ncbi:histone H2A deubiquitinase MYSM1 [Oryzias melastigma]|uniref:Myb-like, SWIRM and MPN domain-containing protein 1 n=1 Tax=Oryzias melastigma TaxID=30732 RepID=A0A3B3BPK9_ORYME|nr:histone H2A deubiquitinase MYSM1 [Oryzias melastigma]